LLSLITEAETSGKHKLRVVLEKSRFEEDTFHLYQKYQVAIHKDDPKKLTPKKYSEFLVDSPLVVKIGNGNL
jgi:arginyl-tRNA--protein-N-Asp/Glu arginylyltransferase